MVPELIEETKEQLELEAEIKAQAQKFIKYLNSTLPEGMALERSEEHTSELQSQ